MTQQQMNAVADAIKAEFRTLEAKWFVDDARNNGPCDMTPWNLLAIAAVKAWNERNRTMSEKQQDWDTAIGEAMGAIVGMPINRKTLTALINNIQWSTPGFATLLPSDFSDGEVRVKVEFRSHVVVATVRPSGVELVRG